MDALDPEPLLRFLVAPAGAAPWTALRARLHIDDLEAPMVCFNGDAT
jgi:hypothetical protein